MVYLYQGLLGGFLMSAHCIGMCGGFAVAIGARTKQPLLPILMRQLVYSSGRLCTYVFLGAMAGFAGAYLSRYQSALISAQQVFSILAGVMMLIIGASVLGLLPVRWIKTGALGSLFGSLFSQLLNARGWGGYFLAGLANGFLPCGPVYAFVALAAVTGSMAGGVTVMVGFGLGTTPAMVAIGCGSSLLSHAVRLRVYRAAAVLVVLMGGVTIHRAFAAPAGDCCSHDADTTEVSVVGVEVDRAG